MSKHHESKEWNKRFDDVIGGSYSAKKNFIAYKTINTAKESIGKYVVIDNYFNVLSYDIFDSHHIYPFYLGKIIEAFVLDNKPLMRVDRFGVMYTVKLLTGSMTMTNFIPDSEYNSNKHIEVTKGGVFGQNHICLESVNPELLTQFDDEESAILYADMARGA